MAPVFEFGRKPGGSQRRVEAEAAAARGRHARRPDCPVEAVTDGGYGGRVTEHRRREALAAIMSNRSPVLVVMGTGGGKSLLFQLPARSQKSGTTVVVVPLKTLEHSLHTQCC